MYSVPVPVHVVEHPLVQDALLTLRDSRTGPEEFRRMATRISVLLAAEAMRDLPDGRRVVQTPLGPAPGRGVTRMSWSCRSCAPGSGMLDAVLELVPGARVGHIGLQRDETTAVASQYYSKLPGGLGDSYVLMIDPMLATGGSAVAGLDLLCRGRRPRRAHRVHRCRPGGHRGRRAALSRTSTSTRPSSTAG